MYIINQSERCKAHRKEVLEAFHVPRPQGPDILLGRGILHPQVGKAHLPEVDEVILPSLGVDGLLQRRDLPENLPCLRVAGVKGRVYGQSPAESGEAFDHELLETREGSRVGGAGRGGVDVISSAVLDRGKVWVEGVDEVGPAPLGRHSAEDAKGHLSRREVRGVFGEVFDGGYQGLEVCLVGWVSVSFLVSANKCRMYRPLLTRTDPSSLLNSTSTRFKYCLRSSAS